MKKPCAFTNQPLLDHSRGSLNAVKKILSDSYVQTARRRLEKFGIKVKKEDFELSVLLHDIGKAGEFYQTQFDDECSSRRTPSFLYHEIGSAIFFYRNIEDERLKLLIALAELNHLNAIRSVSQLNPNSFPKRFNPGMIKLKKFGKVILEELGLENLSVGDYTFDDYHEMMGELVRENGSYLKLYSLFLSPIIVGDNLDSSLARGLNERRRFIHILEKEVNALDSPSV
ncbi:CRISPR-associated endonuclease Cas3'' [Sulfolobus sp. S-194]|uniref:CRISPR-associated endonuclease Cas3'' n=1 Tax=Sulfolobus sp. S-194 TaxID=2512240 RepID=UPI001436D5C0|nr:CRISPR-associated endonuclease Cas3'' [Sulfolobus sp. S-194]QIW22821.1 CRISPR-associated endonuclease Cas3'' [Sulfolobus sp. S-194]